MNDGEIRHINTLIWYCSLSGLQDCIPTLRGDKTSRAQVLKKTGEYITHMQKKINDHQVRRHRDSSHVLHVIHCQDEIKNLKHENTNLESQIRALEKAKATGNYVNARAILETHADSLVHAAPDTDIAGLSSGEAVYDDTSSDGSDSNNAVPVVAGGPRLLLLLL